jgi:hypothetical protein
MNGEKAKTFEGLLSALTHLAENEGNRAQLERIADALEMIALAKANDLREPNRPYREQALQRADKIIARQTTPVTSLADALKQFTKTL